MMGSIFEKIAEDRIKSAMAEGLFDDLPGQGHPIDLSDYFETPPHLRMAYSVLKNANVLPGEIQLKREIEELQEKLKTAPAEQKPAINRRLNERITQFNVTLERYLRR